MVIPPSLMPADVITGASLEVVGDLVQSIGKGQSVEIQARAVRVLGGCGESYPMQKKDHSLEFLRSVPHLRGRTALHAAIWRIRSQAAASIREHLYENEFAEAHAPVITFADCEGAGEAFAVEGCGDFFGAEGHLTVSAQLHAEIAAGSAARVFTFGPIFRAEKHSTGRHLSEFWMLEPEIAFMDSLEQLMSFIEGLLQGTTLRLLERSREDLNAIGDALAARDQLEQRWKCMVAPFERMTYAAATDILSRHMHRFTHKLGNGLQLEHERFLAETVVGGPVFVTDYPKDQKPFYMRQNEDGETVACCDLLVPGLAELVGGSLREERLGRLEARMGELQMPVHRYEWYLDLRRYGSVPHGGFGLGFERYLQYMTGLGNIRDVCLIPRTPGQCSY